MTAATHRGNFSIILFAVCVLLPAAMASAALEQTVLNGLSGPVYAPDYYSVLDTDNNMMYPSGTTPPDLTAVNFFNILGTQFPGYPSEDAQVLDTQNNPHYGRVFMEIDLLNPNEDSFGESIDFGSVSGSPTGLVTLFSSTDLLGFGAVNGVTGEYWFAFQQSSPGTPYAYAGELIGGVFAPGSISDIKTAAIPEPASATIVLAPLMAAGLRRSRAGN